MYGRSIRSGNRAQQEQESWAEAMETAFLLGVNLTFVSCEFSDSIPPDPTRAPQHISDTDTWGVSDPAGRPRGRGVAIRGRGRSRPFLAATPVLGRYRAAQTAARPGSAPTSVNIGSSMDCSASVTAVALESRGQSGRSPPRGGGQPRLGVASPSSAPFVGVRTVMGRTMVESQLAHDPRARRPSSGTC